jgi:eukaryotic-like serine/threonine-protein kinase
VEDDRRESAPAGDRTWVQGSGASAARTDETIGNYRVLRTLGEGGMGLVYEAEQLRPVRRRVALKVIRTGLDTDDVRLRFESERQALALMDHPAIARVFDAGVTAEGRPFFAMELVDGVPITELCDRERLDLEERLRLFALVCEGVQHAHQKGIIHRDIKPSNVLVAGSGSERSIKIIDFGVAKATTERLTDRTFMTEMGQLVGTPQYMSPEQADMRGLDIDTRTDVYLLGTLLHELLTGCLPFDPRLLHERGLTEYRRQVVEVDPLRPSERFARLEPATAREVAQLRSIEPLALVRALRGDLDAITVKALEKDRAQRYASASELAADVGRFLRNEPVTATPPTGLYQLRKFARRHRVGVAFASVVVVLLAVFGVSMAVYASALARARDRAENQTQAANQVADYLVEMFDSSDPENPEKVLGAEVTARDVLNKGLARIKNLEGQPVLQARMLHTMGGVYTNAGLYGEARPLLEEALRIRRSQPDVPAIDVADTESSLAGLLVQLGEFDRVRELYQRALDTRVAELGPTDPKVASSLTNLANILGVMGRDEEAAPLHKRALDIRLSRLAPDDPDLALSRANQAMHLERAGKYAEARTLYEQALATWRRSNPPNSPRIARTLERLGSLAEAEGDLPTAVRYHEQALELRRSIYGNDYGDVAKSLLALATLSARQGDMVRATTLHDEALAIYERSHQLDTPIVSYQEAGYLATVGRTAEAVERLRLAVVDGGYANANELLRDVRFRSLAADPGFQAIVSEAKRGHS